MNIYIDDLAFEMAKTQARQNRRDLLPTSPALADKHGKPRNMASAFAAVLTVTALLYSLPRAAEEWGARACHAL